MTHYTASDSGWCGFRTTHDVLPEFVRQRYIVAIAEPWNGSSYGGEVGEACGECWEIDSIYGKQTVMVADLCPVEGNPVCAGDHFHFDLSSEAFQILGDGEASAHRIPCPVSGNIHIELNSRNEWGYVSLAFFNHRFPIRYADYRAADSDEWIPLTREGGSWRIENDNYTFSKNGPGGTFRFTSPSGEIIQGNQVLTYEYETDDVFDTGVNFEAALPLVETCEYYPPSDVYDEGYGGIDGARWTPNPWGNATMKEISTDCAQDSESCILIKNMSMGDGFHIYYRNPFPVSTFSTLTLSFRAQSGSGSLVVAPSNGSRCTETTIEANSEWQSVVINVPESCSEFSEINGVTFSSRTDNIDLVVDEIYFD
ncbi:MAG: hypothetical protein JXR95_04255 [Deltaproteobacteria bacterium]|nr:hypothetical protein [Deltaproteobacteria bacterium]